MVTPTSRAIAVRTYVAKITGRGSGWVSPSAAPGYFRPSPAQVAQANGSTAGRDTGRSRSGDSIEPSPSSSISGSTKAPSSAATPTPTGGMSPRQRQQLLKRRESDRGTSRSNSRKSPSSWGNYSVLGFKADTNEARNSEEAFAHKGAGPRVEGPGGGAAGVGGISPSSESGSTTDSRTVLRFAGTSRSRKGLNLGGSGGAGNSQGGGGGGISPMSVSEFAQKVSALAADVVSVFSKTGDKGPSPLR